MAKILWDATGEKIYRTGTDRGVVYPINDNGVYDKGFGWDGLTGVTESPSGVEETALWANNHKYGSLYSAEQYSFTIAAYDSPEEFDECDGSKEVPGLPGAYITMQDRRTFGFTHRVLIGNDVKKNKYAYEIHIAYGATASPAEKQHSTTNDSVEVENPTWQCNTIPVPVTTVPGVESTAHLVFDSRDLTEAQLKVLEDTLYGTDATEAVGTEGEDDYVPASEGSDPRLPLPDQLFALLKAAV
jgi:hypothetical protein